MRYATIYEALKEETHWKVLKEHEGKVHAQIHAFITEKQQEAGISIKTVMQPIYRRLCEMGKENNPGYNFTHALDGGKSFIICTLDYLPNNAKYIEKALSYCKANGVYSGVVFTANPAQDDAQWKTLTVDDYTGSIQVREGWCLGDDKHKPVIPKTNY